MALDDALTTLEKLDPGQARTVELRFFGGVNSGGSRRSLVNFLQLRSPRLAHGPGLVTSAIKSNDMTPERYENFMRVKPATGVTSELTILIHPKRPRSCFLPGG